jgi:salicylate hydroxylase
MPTELTNHTREGFQFAEVPVSDILAGQYAQLDHLCVKLIENSVDRMPWRLYIHQPYSVSFPLLRFHNRESRLC